MPTPLWTDDARRQHLRRNFFASAIDGGFYQAAMALLAVETFLPALVHQLGGPTWLVALSPSLYQYGFLILPVFVAARTEQLRRFMPLIAWSSIPQRTIPLLSGLALLFLRDSHPRLTLWLVALTPLLISCFGGLNVTAFWQLFAKVLPANRRSSNLGLRNILGTVLGFAVATAGATVLARRGTLEGAGLLYVGSFGFMLLSLVFFCRMRELPHEPPPHDPDHDARARLRSLPTLWRSDAIFRRYVTARVCLTGLGAFTPFLSLHALAALDRPESYVGRFVAAQMFGGILGNLLTAWIGDRWSSRAVVLLGGWLSLLLCAAAPFPLGETGFLVLFALFGAVTFINLNGASTLVLELFPAARRTNCFALSQLLLAPAMLLAALSSAWLRDAAGTLWIGAALAAVLTAAGLRCYYRLPAAAVAE